MPKVNAESFSSSAKIWTDKADYHPATTVTIYGQGFDPYANVALDVTKVKDGTVTNWNIISKADGSFTTSYQIDKQGAPLYKIDATDGTNKAKTTFTDSSLIVTDITTSSTTRGYIGDTIHITGDTLRFGMEINGTTITGYDIEWFDGSIPVAIWPVSSDTFDLTETIPSSSYGSITVTLYTEPNLDTVMSTTFTVDPTRITQPIAVEFENSAAQATVTITGGNPSPSTFPADGSVHNIIMDDGASFTLSFSNTGNKRNGFEVDDSFSATSDSYVASTNSISETAYAQVQNTFVASGLSGPDSVELIGTYLGDSDSLIVTLNSGNSWTSVAWSDYNSAVTFPAFSEASSENERWSIGDAFTTSALTAGGGVYSPHYYYQFQNGFKVHLIEGNDTVVLTGIYLGVSGSTIVTLPADDTYHWAWSDDGSNNTFPISSTLSTSTERWSIGSSEGLPITLGNNTYSVTYYHQYKLTVTGGNGLIYGGTASRFSDMWFDAGANPTISSNWVYNTVGSTRVAVTNWQLDGSNQNPPRQYAGQLTASVTMNSAHAINFMSTTQYSITFTESGVNSDANSTILQVPLGGSSITYTSVDSGSANGWIDTGTTWGWTNPVSCTDPNKQFVIASGAATGTILAPGTITITYQEQYYLALSSAYGSPTGSGWYNVGSIVSFGVPTPTGTGTTRHAFTGWSSNSGGYTGNNNDASITMNNPITETASWKTQYQITLAVTLLGAAQ